MRRLILWLLVLATLAVVFVAGFPLWVIRPFASQRPRFLALAMTLRAQGGWATLVGLAVIVACALALLWRRRPVRDADAQAPRRHGGKAVAGTAIAGLVLGVLAAWIAHVDYFQWIFHPDQNVHAVAIAQAHWPDSAMVLDVSLGGQARAYPVREMGYYHVVNDRLGGEPIVATY